MNTRKTFIILVILQISVITASFGILYSIEITEKNSADHVNISGKNRMYTALLLHELDKFNSGKIPLSAVDLLFDEFHDNILLLKNGGNFLGKTIKPISDEYTSDILLIEENFFKLKELTNQLDEYHKLQKEPDPAYHLNHEIIEIKLLGASEDLTQKLNFNFNKKTDEKENLELVLPIINGAVYFATIFIIFKTLKRENTQIQKLQKLSIIGQMASRLAHDLRNPIAVIKTSLEMLEIDEDPKNDRTQKMLGRIKKSSINITRLIDDVLEFARTKQLTKSKTSLLKILNNTILSLDIPEGITLDLPKDDVVLNCDEEKMKGVFVNLFSNGFYAMENKGTLSVKVKSTINYIEISVIDSGSGIPNDMMPMVFEPLFSSKPTGTGLGLGICKNIIEQHNGKISVKNNPTTFTITLPTH